MDEKSSLRLIHSFDLPESERDKLLKIGKFASLKKGTFFISAGEIPLKMAFVLQGLFRYVYINDKGVEFTKGFIVENNFLTSYSSMIHGKPSYFFIEALEDSELFVFNYANWLELRVSNPVWDKFLILQLEKAFTIKEKRERELLLLDAETRYQIFLEEFPSLEKRVKQHVIASYLGIKPESLSRIRKALHS